MQITTTRVKELRELSSAGVMECKRALEQTGGDIERALQVLRAQGLAQAARRTGREASQGIIEAYIHGDGRIGVLVEVNCETDFVARTEDFRQLTHDLALQVAATNPPLVGNEQDGAAAKPESDDPDAIPLLRQPFIKDPARTVADVVQEVAAKTRENIVVRRFIRYQLGG